jgi:TRAP transporter TAXI family solute receptor
MKSFSAIRGAIAGLALSVGTMLPAAAEFNDTKPITYSVDGATATGYGKAVTEAINGIVREMYPGTDATYKPGSPAGGIQNIGTGKSDFTFNGAPPEIAYALEGKAPFKESLKDKFRFVMLLHDGLVVHSVMTKDWADKNSITSFEDIAKKKPYMRLAVNQPANLQSTIGMYVNLFQTFGIDEKEVTNNGQGTIRANSASGLEAMRDGKIDVLINGGFIPTAEIADVARGRDLVWISGSADKMQEAAKRWNIKPITVPKSAYDFLKKDEPTITIWNVVLAGAHVSDETVYKFTKALFDNEARVRSIHPSLTEFSLAHNWSNSTPLAIHPGAERYYREKGLIK